MVPAPGLPTSRLFAPELARQKPPTSAPVPDVTCQPGTAADPAPSERHAAIGPLASKPPLTTRFPPAASAAPAAAATIARTAMSRSGCMRTPYP